MYNIYISNRWSDVYFFRLTLAEAMGLAAHYSELGMRSWWYHPGLQVKS